MGRYIKLVLAAACMMAASVLGVGEARADKLADILSKGVVRIIVFADVPPFGSLNAEPRARRLRHRPGQDGGPVAGREARAGAGHGGEPYSVPAHRQGRHEHRRHVGDAGAGAADHVQRALCRHLARGLRPESRAVKSAADLGRTKIAVAKGTTEDHRPDGRRARRRHHAHGGQRDLAVQAYLSGQARSSRGQQRRRRRAGEEEPGQGVRLQVRPASRAGPRHGPDGRAQPAALARYLHLPEHAERRARQAAREVAGRADAAPCRRSRRPAAAPAAAPGPRRLHAGSAREATDVKARFRRRGVRRAPGARARGDGGGGPRLARR